MWDLSFTTVYPDKCNIQLVAIDDKDVHDKHIAFWENVYGFKMSCMQADVVKEASVDIVKPDKIISEPTIIKVIMKLYLCWQLIISIFSWIFVMPPTFSSAVYDIF